MNIVRHKGLNHRIGIKSSLKLKSIVKHFKRFRVGKNIEHKEMYKIKKCGTHLTFFI